VSEAMIAIRTADGEGVVTGGEFEDMVDAVRQIPGRRWDPQARAWRLPCTLDEARRQLQVVGLRVEGSATVIIQEEPPAVQEPPPPSRPRDQVTVRATDGEAGVVGGPFWDMVRLVKTIEGRRWQPRDKVWELPCTLEVAQRVVEAAGFSLRLPGEEALAPPPVSEETAPSTGGWTAQVRIQATDGPAVVTGGPFRAIVDAVKTIEGRRWQPGPKHWQLPCSLDEAARLLEKVGYTVVVPDSLNASSADGGAE
jgi:hypothetical protein